MKKHILLLMCSLLTCTVANAQWQVEDTITQANFISVHFRDADHGIISGQMQGRFFKNRQWWPVVGYYPCAFPGTAGYGQSHGDAICQYYRWLCLWWRIFYKH